MKWMKIQEDGGNPIVTRDHEEWGSKFEYYCELDNVAVEDNTVEASIKASAEGKFFYWYKGVVDVDDEDDDGWHEAPPYITDWDELKAWVAAMWRMQ
jgi:hypothetical protein